jgi:hypothetical protein
MEHYAYTKKDGYTKTHHVLCCHNLNREIHKLEFDKPSLKGKGYSLC